MKMTQVVKGMKKRGWTLEPGKKHIKATPPNGGPFLFLPQTPRIDLDKNVLAMVHRAERGALAENEGAAKR